MALVLSTLQLLRKTYGARKERELTTFLIITDAEMEIQKSTEYSKVHENRGH